MGRVFNVDKKGQLTVAAAILLALITLFTSYDHITIPGAHASLQLPQQAGIPLLAAAVAAAVGEAQLASNSRAESAEVRDRTEAEAARRAQLQARSHFGFCEAVALLCSSSTSSTPPQITPDSSEA